MKFTATVVLVLLLAGMAGILSCQEIDYPLVVSPAQRDVDTPFVVHREDAISTMTVTPQDAKLDAKGDVIEKKRHAMATWQEDTDTAVQYKAKSPPVPAFASSFVAATGGLVVEGKEKKEGEGQPMTWKGRITEPPSRVVIAHQYPGEPDNFNEDVVRAANVHARKNMSLGGVYIVRVGVQGDAADMSGVASVLQRKGVTPAWVKWVDSAGHGCKSSVVTRDPQSDAEWIITEVVKKDKDGNEIGYTETRVGTRRVTTVPYSLAGSSANVPAPGPGEVNGHPILRDFLQIFKGAHDLPPMTYVAYANPLLSFLERRTPDPERKKGPEWANEGVWTLYHCFSAVPGTDVNHQLTMVREFVFQGDDPVEVSRNQTVGDGVPNQAGYPAPTALLDAVIGEAWTTQGTQGIATFNQDGFSR